MKKSIQLSFWDHLLVLIACSSSLFALGESLSKHLLANFLGVGSAFSILLGFFLSKLLAQSKFLKYDAYIWTAFAFMAAIFSMPLNAVLPEDGFPLQLFAGTWLSWMVLSCGLVSWRDQTLLFLCLPCLSVFALVGTFDTFAPATLLFFVFLLCSSLLYARIHQRSMIARAKLAGQENPALLERDAWRWMAGPEWAFVSAGAIIVFSLIFGPLLRFSLGPVAGSVKVSLPQGPNPNSPNTPSYRTDMQIGRGPVSLSKDTVFRVKADDPSYFRTSFYTDYQGDGWSRFSGRDLYVRMGIEPKSMPRSDTWIQGWPNGIPLEKIENPVVKTITLDGAIYDLTTYPTPGPILKLKTNSRSNIIFSPTGLAYRQNGTGRAEKIEIQYLEPPAGATPGEAKFPVELQPILRHYLDTTKVTDQVREFVRQATKGANSDLEKAIAIKTAIASQVKYTLAAPALSPKDDSVDQFLFTTKRGYCDLFATSMVMCARVAGLPSRYMVGYLVNNGEKDAEGYTKVLGTDAHAWAEIYFDKVGWMKFDATEGAQEAEQTVESQEDAWYRQPWAVVGFASLAIVLVLGTFVFVQNKSAAKQPKFVNSERILAIQAHQEFDRVLRKHTTVVRRLSQSLSEYISFVSVQLGPHNTTADQIREDVERACYGKEELPKTESLALIKRIKSFGRELGTKSKA